MSEVASRPSNRGRSATRGGRGRGTAPRISSRQPNGHSDPSFSEMDVTDQGELGEIKKKYLTELSTLKELFPDWTEVDLVFALDETDGDLNNTIERITEGNMSQFSDVKKKTKDRSRSKVKETTPAAAESGYNAARSSRGKLSHDASNRARSSAPRSRGTPRGRGGHASITGSRQPAEPVSVPTNESSAWDTIPTADASAVADEKPAEAADATSTSKNYEPPKTWASMFAKPKQTPPPKKAATEHASTKPTRPPADDAPASNGLADTGTGADAATSKDDATEGTGPPVPVVETTQPTDGPVAAQPDITPSKDQLTQDNVEHLPDASHPAPVGTAASTVASSATHSQAHQAAIPRTPMTGYSAVAMKAAGVAGRSASFTRRVQEQQEAVVMPGNHAIDRAAVQFGSLGLNGDSEALDIDDEREELETRAQPPQHSPVTQPRTALPPSRQTPAQPEPAVPTGLPTPKQPSSLPQASQQAAPPSVGPPPGVPQPSQQYSQFGRFGPASTQAELPAQQGKAYDPFGPPQGQQSAFEQFQNQATQPPQSQAQAAPTTAASDYPNYYGSDQSRASQNYYGAPYGQQQPSSQPEGGAAQQRTGSSFGAAPSDSSFGTSQAPQAQSRYGEPQTSGQNTPNPTLSGQHHMGSQSQHIPQPHQQNQYGSGTPFGNPYYNSHYYNAYMNQFGGFQGGYGPYGKSGMYGQPHHNYGMSPQTSYDQHSSSPGAMAGFGQASMHGREGMSAGLSEYSRSGSSQPPAQQHSSTSGFGAVPDVFGRSQAGFPSQVQYGQQASGPSGSDDALKAYSDSKGTAGPAPAALGQPGRPSSATNNAASQSNPSGLPPTQSSNQQGFGGYPNHMNMQGGQGSQYGGLPGLGGHQAGQNHQSGYGGYGSGFGSYAGYRGGWGNNYSGH